MATVALDHENKVCVGDIWEPERVPDAVNNHPKSVRISGKAILAVEAVDGDIVFFKRAGWNRAQDMVSSRVQKWVLRLRRPVAGAGELPGGSAA